MDCAEIRAEAPLYDTLINNGGQLMPGVKEHSMGGAPGSQRGNWWSRRKVQNYQAERHNPVRS